MEVFIAQSLLCSIAGARVCFQFLWRVFQKPCCKRSRGSRRGGPPRPWRFLESPHLAALHGFLPRSLPGVLIVLLCRHRRVGCSPRIFGHLTLNWRTGLCVRQAISTCLRNGPELGAQGGWTGSEVRPSIWRIRLSLVPPHPPTHTVPCSGSKALLGYDSSARLLLARGKNTPISRHCI